MADEPTSLTGAQFLAALIGPPRFGYAAFINELRSLIERGRGFNAEASRWDSEAFKAWKHEATDLIRRINRLRYSVNCKIEDRLFRVNSSIASSNEQRRKFEEDLGDTLMELELLVKNYDKWGDPKENAKPIIDITKQQSPAFIVGQEIVHATMDARLSEKRPTEERMWPEKDKMTMAWLWHNMPASNWWWLAGLLVAAFGFGFAVASWQPIATVLTALADKSKPSNVKPSIADPGAMPVPLKASQPIPAVPVDRASDPGIFNELNGKAVDTIDRVRGPASDSASTVPFQGEKK